MDQLRLWNFSKCDLIDPSIARFSTCMRTLYFSFSDCSELGAAHYRGSEAHLYLMQVLCGLESPVFGETEVFGQFKIQMEDFPADLKSFVQSVLSDVKSVRHQHLKNTGGSSYGSFAREYLQGAKSILLLGAGHLSHEIYPWLAKSSAQITVATRTAKPFGVALGNNTSVQLMSEISNLKCDLIIAAPISNQDLRSWLDSHHIECDRVLDLRADVSSFSPKALSLSEVFARLKENQSGQEQLRALVIQEIEGLIQKRLNQASLRPFGWEDLCI